MVVVAFSRNKVIVVVLISVAILVGYYYFFSSQPITVWDYYGNTLTFRQDLREAQKVSVYPSEARLQEVMWNPKVTNITMVFIETNDTQYTVVESVEIVPKLRVAYQLFVTNRTVILTMPNEGVESLDNLPSTEENPFIVLVPPSIGDETAVRIEGNTIFIKAKYDPDPKVAIKNFDLVTIKFIMTVLDIKLK